MFIWSLKKPCKSFIGLWCPYTKKTYAKKDRVAITQTLFERVATDRGPRNYVAKLADTAEAIHRSVQIRFGARLNRLYGGLALGVHQKGIQIYFEVWFTLRHHEHAAVLPSRLAPVRTKKRAGRTIVWPMHRGALYANMNDAAISRISSEPHIFLTVLFHFFVVDRAISLASEAAQGAWGVPSCRSVQRIDETVGFRI